MLIAQAFAAEVPPPADSEIPAAPGASGDAATTTSTVQPSPADMPSAREAFMWNIGMVLVLVILFYVLLIMPQQRRFKEHRQMISGLKKGDEIVTGGGFLGRIDKIIDDNEMLIDLGNGLKVTALRSTVNAKPAAAKGKNAPLKTMAAATDDKTDLKK